MRGTQRRYTLPTDAMVEHASASKWIYGMYVVQNRGGAVNLSAAHVKFLNFTSGYSTWIL